MPFLTTQELLDHALELVDEQDIIIQAAAPADYRAREIAPQKIKKQSGEPMTLTLVENPDVAARLDKRKKQVRFLSALPQKRTTLLNTRRAS